MTNLTHAEAVTALQAGTCPYVEYRTKDATLSHWQTVRCWLDSDGDLVQTHPTDSQRSPLLAPTGVRYSVPSAEQLAADAQAAEIDAADIEALDRYNAEHADEINA